MRMTWRNSMKNKYPKHCPKAKSDKNILRYAFYMFFHLDFLSQKFPRFQLQFLQTNESTVYIP